MYLYINTSQFKRMVLALLDEKGEILKLKKVESKYQQSERLLKEINKLRFKNKKLKGIVVVVGPGGFASLRIGVATANAIAWSLNIPILGIENKKNLDDRGLIKKNVEEILNKKEFKQVLPKYGKEPNITLKNKLN